MSEPRTRYGAYLAEFVGTTVLVLAITGFVSASSRGLDLLPLAMVYTIGSISGAHVNPAVTLASPRSSARSVPRTPIWP